jgi:hypothetical protein
MTSHPSLLSGFIKRSCTNANTAKLALKLEHPEAILNNSTYMIQTRDESTALGYHSDNDITVFLTAEVYLKRMAQ